MKASHHLFLLCPLMVCAVLAQDAPEITSHQAPATFTTRTNLVSVPVVVRDGNGRAVGNLRQEDFRLFDKGKPQIITKFSVNRSGGSEAAPAIRASGGGQAEKAVFPLPAVPAPVLPDRYVAYVFDDIHLKFEDLARVRTATEQHFAASLVPTSRAAIYTTSGRVTLDFTADREKLHEALLRIGPAPSTTLRPGDSCPDVINTYEADLFLNHQDDQAYEAAVQELRQCLPGAVITKGTVIMIAQRALSANNINTQSVMNVLTGVIQRISVMPGSRSIVLASPGFLPLSELRAKETDLMDRAIHSNVTISGLDARGLLDPWLGEAAGSKDGLNSIRMRYRREAADANKDVMAELAEGTGGKFFKNDNGLKEGLNLLAAQPEYTYVLGFAPQNLKYDGSYHGLKVAIVNSKGLELQARRGYWAPNHAEDAAEQATNEIRDAVFSLDELHDIPADVTTEFLKLNETSAELTVDAHLNLNGLKFRTAGDRSEDTLTVVTGVFDRDGHYVSGIQRVIDMRLREPTLAKLLNSGMAVKETFNIPPGRYVVRVVVRDSDGQAMAARNGTVDIR